MQQLDKTLLKGLSVLEHVIRVGRPVRASDVADELAMHRGNAHRVLKTLEAAGYLIQDPHSREYAPSLRLWELGTEVLSRFDLRERSSEVLRELARSSEETVHLSVLEGLDVIYIEKIDSSQPVGAYSKVGGRAPAYCVATGKAMLAALSPDELAPIMQHLERPSPNTLEPDALRQDLLLSRQRGYAINRGEWRDTVWGVAAPIHDASDRMVAAVGVSGPEFRLAPAGRCEALGVLVMEAAQRISGRLGNRRSLSSS